VKSNGLVKHYGGLANMASHSRGRLALMQRARDIASPFS